MSGWYRRPIMKLYEVATGRRFLTRLDELNRQQWLGRGKLLDLQRAKLHRLVSYAYQRVPYYQRQFDQAGFNPDDVLTDMRRFRRLPILTKASIHDNFEAIQTTDPKLRESLVKLTTGGSTGRPLVFLQDANFRDFVTADIHRHLGWADWKLGQIHAYIWGANFEVATKQALRVRLMNWLLNRFVTNAYVLSEESMGQFAGQIRRHRPRILFGYPSSLYRFAEFVRERDMLDIRFDAIFSSAEVLYPGQRQFIEEVFNGRMFNRYGTRELGGLGCECQAHTGLHASIDNVLIEIVTEGDDGELAGPGEPGRIVVTNLNNFGMPFIRYSIEDIGAWSTLEKCSCGRELPLMELVQGRRIDMFKTRDGRAVWGGFASPLFGMAGVRQFQLVQKSLDLVVARIVRSRPLDESRLQEIERTVHRALGDDVRIEFEFPEDIPVLASGKYRYAISELSN